VNGLFALLLALPPGIFGPPSDSLILELGGRATVWHTGELAQLPRDSVRWSDNGTVHTYRGVWLVTLLRRAGLPMDTLRGPNLTKRVVVEAADGYRAVFTLAELAPGLGSRGVLIADRQDGEPLPGAVGPFRLIVPGDGSGARAVRQVTAFRVRDEP
jgi:hypothetical protein